MVKDELDIIRELNVSDEKKLDIFKETKFKELEEETNRVRITEEGLTDREKEKTKHMQETTKQVIEQERSVQLGHILGIFTIIFGAAAAVKPIVDIVNDTSNNQQSEENIESEE